MSWTGENKFMNVSLSDCGYNYWGKEVSSKNLIQPKEHINYNSVVVCSL